MIIRQHIPSFVDGVEPQEQDFSTIEELLSVSFVARWNKTPNFIRYSKSDNCLMAEIGPSESNPAGSHWVIGFLSDPSRIDLPLWQESDAQRLRREAWNRGEI